MLKKDEKKALLVFLAPAVILYSLIYIYPTIRTTLMSFFEVSSLTTPIKDWVFVGFENYINIFSDTLFLQSVINLVKIWVFGGIIVLISALIFAIILTSGIKGSKFFRAVIYLPNMITAVALGTMWTQYIYNNQYGLFHTAFSALGLETLANFPWTALENMFIAMLIAYSYSAIGYFMLTFIAGIERIPKDYYEAASIEGANVLVSFRFITLPLLVGVMKTVFVLWTVRTLGFFIWSQVFSPLTADLQTVTPMVYMYRTVFGSELVVETNTSGGAVVGVFLVVVTVIMFGISNLLFRDKVEEI